MKQKNSFRKQTSDTVHSKIPNIEVIDLELEENTNDAEFSEESVFEDDLREEDNISDEPLNDGDSAEDSEAHAAPAKKGWRSFLNMHTLLLFVFVVFVVCIVVKFKNWGVRVDISDIQSDNSETYYDVLDQILPLTDENGKAVKTGKADTVVVFGNAPFADDRDSKDNLANLIADATGATVYNCSIGDSYIAAQNYYFSPSQEPMDAYTFYWLVTLAATGANTHYYEQAAEALGDATPPEAQEVYDILTTLDFNTVDVIAVMYDATDYLLGHEMYDDANDTNIEQFTGNLEAGIELLQKTYPHIRIIVMSPTYAYALDDNGEYVSSDMYTYGQDVLSTYVIKQYSSCASRSVTFIDNLYGTITENNAQDYLTDHLHLNVEGRKLVAQRFIDALTHYDK